MIKVQDNAFWSIKAIPLLSAWQWVCWDEGAPFILWLSNRDFVAGQDLPGVRGRVLGKAGGLRPHGNWRKTGSNRLDSPILVV